MAPELFPDFDILIDEDAVDDDNTPLFSPELTKQTDVYAYGLVLLQVPPRIIYPGSFDLGLILRFVTDPHGQGPEALPRWST